MIADIIGVGAPGVNDVSLIISSNLKDLSATVLDLDISDVSWIKRPVINPSLLQEYVRPSIPTPDSSSPASDVEYSEPKPEPGKTMKDTASISHYRDLIGQMIKIARNTANGGAVDSGEQQWVTFEPHTAFGISEVNGYAHSNRLGAAGEAFAFEYLSALKLPNFTIGNWQSNIRGELRVHPEYNDLQNWNGKEAADIVYTDRHGDLTRELRRRCTGGFPTQIPEDHDHSAHPIEYYLETKTTAGSCTTRFSMSDKQYKKMVNMALRPSEQPTKVYVIIRVFNLVKPNAGCKIYVDPHRLEGTLLEFEADQWHVRTR